jgi:hypothetical protein
MVEEMALVGVETAEAAETATPKEEKDWEVEKAKAGAVAAVAARTTASSIPCSHSSHGSRLLDKRSWCASL